MHDLAAWNARIRASALDIVAAYAAPAITARRYFIPVVQLEFIKMG
jgi:hypothetical protein